MIFVHCDRSGAETMDNETWVIKEGDRIIRKMAALGYKSLTPWETLVYALWHTEYAVRNGEILEAIRASCDLPTIRNNA